MSQLCIYLDDATMDILHTQAKQRNQSLSKCAAEDIRASAQKSGWPAYFAGLYGSIEDPSFERPFQGDPSLDDDPTLYFSGA